MRRPIIGLRRSIAAFFAATAIALLGAGAAGAATVTVGSPLRGEFTWPEETTGPSTFINTLTNPGANLVSPVDGAVIRWRLSEGFIGTFRLQIVNRTGGDDYFGGPYSATGSANLAPASFSTIMPIRKGETVALVSTGANEAIGVNFEPRSRTLFETIDGLLPPGRTEGGTHSPFGHELGFNAEILPAPAVGTIAPVTGPATGGTKVTIPGTSFSQVTKVLFGSTPATSFKVESEDKIVATAPAATAPAATAGSSVPVSVTTVAGTATAGNKFTYQPKPKTGKAGKGKKPKAS
jgi:hypothetical protein